MDMEDNYREAVRIEIEGVTASFRYPHFLMGRQPTYPMPPLTTIYGLISAALGNFPEPENLQVAYSFTCETERTDDLEKLWFIEANTATRGVSKDYNLNASSNVQYREMLINPKLTLYIIAPNSNAVYNAFREPKYTLLLGRSQDLVSVRTVTKVNLKIADSGRLSPGLLPHGLREYIPEGISINMPRFINPENRHEINWDWFIALEQPAKLAPNQKPEITAYEDTSLGAKDNLLFFHQFVEEVNEANIR